MVNAVHAAGWSIRRFKPSDSRSCIAIFRTCLNAFAWRGPMQDVRPLVASLIRFETWVAEEPQAGIVGFLTMDPLNAYVDHLFVDEDWRFCGVGSGLLEAARDKAGRRLTLTVDRENRFARGAYEAMGWEPTGEAGGRGQGAWIRLRSR